MVGPPESIAHPNRLKLLAQLFAGSLGVVVKIVAANYTQATVGRPSSSIRLLRPRQPEAPPEDSTTNLVQVGPTRSFPHRIAMIDATSL